MKIYPFLLSILLSHNLLHGQSIDIINKNIAPLQRQYTLQSSYNLKNWFNTGPIPFSSNYLFFRLKSTSIYDIQPNAISYNTLSNVDTYLRILNNTNVDFVINKVLEFSFPDGLNIKDNVGNIFFYSWLSSTDNIGSILTALPGAVHESIHMLGFQHIGIVNNQLAMSYRVNDQMYISVPVTSMYNRNELSNVIDIDYPIEQAFFDRYIVQLGNQDIISVLDELNAYCYSDLTTWALKDYKDIGELQWANESLLIFMYYTELYLKHARLMHIDQYTNMSVLLQDVIITLFDRAYSIIDRIEISKDDPIRIKVDNEINEINLLKKQIRPILVLDIK